MNLELLQSASKESEWARAMRLGLDRHGPTPIHDALHQHYYPEVPDAEAE